MLYRILFFLVGLGSLMGAVVLLSEGSARNGLIMGGVGAVAMLAAWGRKGSSKRRGVRGGSRKASASQSGGFSVSVNRGSRKSDLPPPPTLADYVAAGVDPGKCSLCPKKVPANPREWRFAGFDGRPGVVCPSCWNRKFVYAEPDESDKFYKRFTTYCTFEKP